MKKYEAHLESELKKPSIIPLGILGEDQAIAEFKRLRRAHGDESVLKLKLMEVSDAGNKVEIYVPPN